METFGSVAIAMRVYYSSYHLWAARHFTRLAHEIEDAHTGRSIFNITHRSYVTATVLCAVGFLEAAINELFNDAKDMRTSYIEPLGADRTAKLADRWKKSARRSMLKKYAIALKCIGEPAFSESDQFYRDVSLLVRLRNALTHFCPETQYQDTLNELAADLKKRGFPPNRLMQGAGNSYFPDHCLGAGCAGWAVAAAQTFADTFFSRIGVPANYQRTDFWPP